VAGDVNATLPGAVNGDDPALFPARDLTGNGSEVPENLVNLGTEVDSRGIVFFLEVFRKMTSTPIEKIGGS
jgi:hypothetical protein